MNLPTLTIPDIALPFDIPHMVHPLFVHFAIALPVLIILFEVINLIVRKRAVGVTSFMLILLLVVVYIGAYFAGITDGQEAKKLLSPEGKALLGAHKQLGIYLVYGSLLLLLVKMISAAVNSFPARVVFLLILIGFTLVAFNEGKKGGELVYKHGANVKMSTSQAASEVINNVSKEIQKKSEEVKKKASETKMKVEEATKDVGEKSHEAVEKAKETTVKTAETVKEKASEAVQKTKEAAKKAVETIKEKAKEIKEKTKETIEKATQPSNTETPAPTKVTPVETVPAG